MNQGKFARSAKFFDSIGASQFCKRGSATLLSRRAPSLNRKRKRVNVVLAMLTQKEQGAIRRYREWPGSHAERYLQNLFFPPIGHTHSKDPIDSPSHKINVL